MTPEDLVTSWVWVIPEKARPRMFLHTYSYTYKIDVCAVTRSCPCGSSTHGSKLRQNELELQIAGNHLPTDTNKDLGKARFYSQCKGLFWTHLVGGGRRANLLLVCTHPFFFIFSCCCSFFNVFFFMFQV